MSDRKAYLDALRGIAVVVMVGAHVTDAWTRDADRHDNRFFATVFVNGLAAPAFLLLAGVALAMAAESRARKIGPADAARSIHQRGWQVFGLAFLFRVQSQLLGWGPLINLLKVDILNVMGLAMIAAAWIWRAAANRTLRVIGYAAATTALAFITPIVRNAAWPELLPGPIEWYLRPTPNRTTFTMLPWAGFLTGGALAGELLDAVRGPAEERRVQAWLFGAALAAIAVGYAASLQPTIYDNAEFWTSSPTFFFIRLGLIIMLIPMAWAVELSWEPLVTLGRSSLFVYWVHVELVYGALALPLRRLLPWEATVTAAVALCSALYALVQWKNRWVAARQLPSSLRILSPILK